MSVIHYRVARAESEKELEEFVSNLWLNGYRPQGSLVISFVPEHRLSDNTYVQERYIYAQAMIKKGV